MFEKFDDSQQNPEEQIELSPEQTEIPVEKPQKLKVKKLGRLGSIMAGAASIVGIAGSADQASASEARPDTQPTTQHVEKVTMTHKYEERMDALRTAFWEMSAKMMAKADNGDLVIHVGGGEYYDLSDANLATLVEYVDKYMPHASADERTKITRHNMMKMAVKEKIMSIGHKVDHEHLPQSLKVLETERQKMSEEMSK